MPDQIRHHRAAGPVSSSPGRSPAADQGRVRAAPSGLCRTCWHPCEVIHGHLFFIGGPEASTGAARHGHLEARIRAPIARCRGEACIGVWLASATGVQASDARHALCTLSRAAPGTVIIDGDREMLEVHVERMRTPEKERQAVERLGMQPCSEVLLVGAARNKEVRMQNRSHLLLTFRTCLSIPMPVLERPAAFEW